MISIHRFTSLKSKLIIYFTIIINILSISICLFYYNYSREALVQNIINNSYTNIRYLSNNIDKQLKLCENLSDWIYVNRSIEKVLIRDYKSGNSSYNIDIPSVQKLVNDRVASTSIGKYVSFLIISGINGIYLTVGNDTDWIDKKEVQGREWFKDGLGKLDRIAWNGIVENPATVRSDKYIIPVVRPVIFADTRKQIGWSLLGFKPQLISDVFDEYQLGSDDLLFVIGDDGRYIFNSDNSGYVGEKMEYAFNDEILSKDIGHFIAEVRDEKRLVFFMKSAYSGMTIVQAISYKQLTNQEAVVENITLFTILLSIVMSVSFTIFLSFRLTKPLKNILNKMKLISKGDFTRELSLEGGDEMGILGKGINDMSDNIKGLMGKILDEEREKKKLEFKILQSQINPHFIYNTLNSIKLMATIQKCDGISEMVSALGALLKEMSKGASEKITLKEEIDLVDKYIYLHKVRRKGMIRVQYLIRDESLYNYRILKFMLQPIVENAIFHGLESKKGIGLITIEVLEQEAEIVVSVEDNGVGMTAEVLNKVFSGGTEKSSKYNSIGVKNVDERIKLTYGNQYGLKIESVPDEYTRVIIRIPKEK
jgi:two-component system sensor histidine kinase YesM